MNMRVAFGISYRSNPCRVRILAILVLVCWSRRLACLIVGRFEWTSDRRN